MGTRLGPTTGDHIGYSDVALLCAAELLQQAGEVGLHWRDILALIGYAPSDVGGGYLARALREHGFLVQVEESTLTIHPEVAIRQGSWMRHPTLGVVKVRFERPGFDYVTVLPLGNGRGLEGEPVKVARADLSGR
jgi:hypothetical protein